MKKARLATVIFAFLIITFIYGIYGIFSSTLDVTSFWGFGAVASIAALFVFIMLGRVYGYSRALITMLGILAIITLAMMLNSFRSWPFGMSVFHDVLGWKFYKIAWPIPLFWSAIIGGILLLKKPHQQSNDPKVFFSWAFDVSLITMILAIIIEPLGKLTNLVTWISTGFILGVPLSAFLGWFITAFIATFVAIMILRPWNVTEKTTIHHLLPLTYAAFFGLIFALATKKDIVLIQILSAICILIFLIWTLKLGKQQNSSLIAVESIQTEVS